MVSLKKNDEFRQVYKMGKHSGNEHLVVFVLANKLEINRLGISVSKKMGGAVLRNRQRRRIKEAYRALEPLLCPGYDIVVQPKIGLANMPFLQIKLGLESLLKRRGLIKG
jgi:ribonuclease P protein component